MREHSPSGDYTEGLCALADRWIADVAFPSFTETARLGAVPSIAQWFDEPDVQRSASASDAAPALAKTLAALGAAARAAAAGAERLGTDSGAPGTCPVSGRRVPWAPPREQREEVWGAAEAGRASRARSSDTPSPQRGARRRRWAAGGGAFGVRAQPETLRLRYLAVSARPPCRRPPRDVGALLGAAATNVADGAADPAARAPSSRRAPEVDARVAEQIVRRWQSAKAQALGVAHNLRPLEQVLEGPMLQQWLTRAEDVKAHGWAWEYQLNALTVDKVEVMTPSRVMVEATLTEVAVLKDRAHGGRRPVREHLPRTVRAQEGGPRRGGRARVENRGGVGGVLTSTEDEATRRGTRGETRGEIGDPAIRMA